MSMAASCLMPWQSHGLQVLAYAKGVIDRRVDVSAGNSIAHTEQAEAFGSAIMMATLVVPVRLGFPSQQRLVINHACIHAS